MKKLIIVCEEMLRRYGDFLAQLISSTDDKDGKAIGIKDGVAAAQVWTEKEYTSNSAQISSEQYILFIGNSNLIKEKRYHMQKKYSEYGMNYGWLGKQAVLFVDRTLSFDEYEDFYKLLANEYAKENQLKAVRLFTSKSENLIESADIIDDNVEVKDMEIKEIDEPAQQETKDSIKPLVPFVFIGKALKKAVDVGVETFNKISNDINAASKSKDIEEQQYTCLVLLFYLNDLSLFLGMHEE